MSRNKEYRGLSTFNSKENSSIFESTYKSTLLKNNKSASSIKKLKINTAFEKYAINDNLKKKDSEPDPLQNYRAISNILKKGIRDSSGKAFSVQATTKNNCSQNSKISGMNNQCKFIY